MAWETGNELNATNGPGGYGPYCPTGTTNPCTAAPASWTETLAKYIKSIAPHQLASDGHTISSCYPSCDQSATTTPDTDMWTQHAYPDTLTTTNQLASFAQSNNKVFFIGEQCAYSNGSNTGCANLASTLPPRISGWESNTAITGVNIWQLTDNGYGGDQFTLYYPGTNQLMTTVMQQLQGFDTYMAQ
jgi:hypothetical protein